jgi:hypothetical protein
MHQQRKRVPIDKIILPLPKPTAHYEQGKKKGIQKAIFLTVSPYKDHQKLAKEKQNTTELKQQGKKMTKGKLRKRGTPATQEVESKVVTELNHEEWTCMLCQEAVTEDMVCCQHCEKWAHEPCHVLDIT